MLRLLDIYPHYENYLGLFKTPRSGYSFERMKFVDMPIALDNSAYKNFCPKRFTSMLDRARVSEANVSWVAVPDAVADAEQTNRLFAEWHPQMQDLPLAYVAQDGSEDAVIPFSEVCCIFIGGTTDWKLSASAVSVIQEAQRLGKIVHMGRVSTHKRLRYAFQVGIDSVDSSAFNIYTNKELAKALHLLDGLHRQTCLEV